MIGRCLSHAGGVRETRRTPGTGMSTGVPSAFPGAVRASHAARAVRSLSSPH